MPLDATTLRPTAEDEPLLLTTDRPKLELPFMAKGNWMLPPWIKPAGILPAPSSTTRLLAALLGSRPPTDAALLALMGPSNCWRGVISGSAPTVMPNQRSELVWAGVRAPRLLTEPRMALKRPLLAVMVWVSVQIPEPPVATE